MASPFKRLWNRVAKNPTGCWLWTGCKFSNGYGRIRLSGTETAVVHRLAWEATNGAIPGGLLVCHKCDVRHCCNPDHLFLGTDADNVKDCVKKGRRADLRGARHPMAKLNEFRVMKIRAGRAAGFPLSVFAKRYGVTIQAVSLASSGKSWGHI